MPLLIEERRNEYEKQKQNHSSTVALALIIGSLAACGTVTKNDVDLKPTAGVTETPEPTEAPAPTKEVVTPEPTETPVPTAELTETPEPTAEVTPEPIVEVTPEVTEEPTPTVEVIVTPEVTEEPEPTPTLEPTATATPKPTATPAPTATPVPEKTYEASIEGIKELRSEVPEEFILNDDYMVASIKKWFNDDGVFASVSTEELITYYCECKNKPEFTLNLPEEMMNDWVQQNKTPWIHEVGTWRNFVASKVMFIETEYQHPDFSDYEEAEIFGVYFRDIPKEYEVGKVYYEAVQIIGTCGEGLGFGDGTAGFMYYKADEKVYYSKETKGALHLDINFVIEAFEDEETGAYYVKHHREKYDGYLRPIAEGEAYCAMAGDYAYLQFNEPGYYRIKTIVTDSRTGEDLGTGRYISWWCIHITE